MPQVNQPNSSGWIQPGIYLPDQLDFIVAQTTKVGWTVLEYTGHNSIHDHCPMYVAVSDVITLKKALATMNQLRLDRRRALEILKANQRQRHPVDASNLLQVSLIVEEPKPDLAPGPTTEPVEVEASPEQTEVPSV